MADIKSTADRSRNMAAIKSKDTTPELFVRKGLFARGYRYRVSANNIPGHPDIYMARFHTAVFVNGCFWHRHANCKYAYTPKSKVDFWNAKFQSNKLRDEAVRMKLADGGYRQLIIWECAIRSSRKKEEVARVLFEQIERFIHSEIQYLEIDQALLNL